MRSTTILAVKHDNAVAIAGDGQVTLGETVMKSGASKIRTMYKGKVLAGFAGSTADAFSLFTRFEAKLEEYRGNLYRAAVELARDWRMDKNLRRLEAMLLVCNQEHVFVISGTGDVIEPDDGIVAIGSGGPYALAAARGISQAGEFNPYEICERAMNIAANICIYSNDHITIRSLPENDKNE
jgi:ATP-dependent HslUV protease subunit HslV